MGVWMSETDLPLRSKQSHMQPKDLSGRLVGK